MKELPDDILLLQALLSEVLLRLLDLEAENLALRTENAELRSRLGLNSQNSSKPPSSDGLAKKPALPKVGGGKVGGQKGHVGHTLERVATPDAIVLHHAEVCSCCGRVFDGSELCHELGSRQVFDMPEPKLTVIEHKVFGTFCCGQVHRGTYPNGVNAPVQYGVRIHALSALLNTDYRLPFGKISQLLEDLYGYGLSEATLSSANERVFEALAAVEGQIKAAVVQSEVVHFDETGMRVAGKLQWFHTACTTTLSYLFVHAKRGKEALRDSKSVIKEFHNWAIHDCWASYFDFTQAKHGLCNAHILRELTALQESGSLWAAEMHTFLLELYVLSQKATQILPDKSKYYAEYARICAHADEQEPQPIKKPKGKPKNSKGRNLRNRLLKHQDAVLAFAFEKNVPFSNNTAERDIRHVKVKQKVAMSFRTFNGAEVYARIQSFVATTRKQAQNSFQQLCRILNGEEYTFQTT